jgi:hypothetical protein
LAFPFGRCDSGGFRMPDRHPNLALRPARHETGDVSPRSILALLAVIGALLVVMLAVAYVIFPDQLADRRFTLPIPPFPSPTLQTNPAADMAAFTDRELRQLNTMGWQDRKAGTVHIPIDQAMRGVARDGIVGWPTGPGHSAEVDQQ